MTRIRLKHVDRFVDPTGKTRFYFRRGRGTRIPLPGTHGSPEFMAAYQAALDGKAPGQAKLRGEQGSFDRLLQDYFSGLDFARLKPATQRHYRNTLERWVRVDRIGHRPVRTMTAAHVERMIVRRAATPGAANNLLMKIRILMAFARDKGYRDDDPSAKLKRFKLGEHHTWTETEIARFEGRWQEGTKERMAFALLLYTGQRISDVVRMAWPQIENNSIHICQLKTTSKLVMPLHKTLRALLSAWPKRHLVILTNAHGKPFHAKAFSDWMAQRIGEAGVPDHCVTHGLRKAAARRLAEAGATTHQIMAITGHKSLAEVERYTREAAQRSNAAAAMLKLEGRSGNTDSQKG